MVRGRKRRPTAICRQGFEQMCEEFNMEVKVCRKIQSLKHKKITLNFVKQSRAPLRKSWNRWTALSEINVENQHIAPLIARWHEIGDGDEDM